MPYKSEAQRRWAHTAAAKKAGFPTKEYDDASRGMKLPSRKGRTSEADKKFIHRLKGKSR